LSSFNKLSTINKICKRFWCDWLPYHTFHQVWYSAKY